MRTGEDTSTKNGKTYTKGSISSSNLSEGRKVTHKLCNHSLNKGEEAHWGVVQVFESS